QFVFKYPLSDLKRKPCNMSPQFCHSSIFLTFYTGFCLIDHFCTLNLSFRFCISDHFLFYLSCFFDHSISLSPCFLKYSLVISLKILHLFTCSFSSSNSFSNTFFPFSNSSHNWLPCKFCKKDQKNYKDCSLIKKQAK